MPADDPTKAKERLNQVASHLKSSTSTTPAQSKRSRRKQGDAALPADYSDRLSQLDQLRQIASTPPTNIRGYINQKKSGKLWVRERVDLLLDKDSFVEVGSVTGSVEWKPKIPKTEDGSEGKWDGIQEDVVSYVPSNSVQGFGRLNGRKIVFTADDYTIRAGHADGAMWAKSLYLEKLSQSLRLPMIKLVDGSSGGGSVTTIKTQGFAYLPPIVGLDVAVKSVNMGIPNLGAVLGPAIGLGAARVTMCHFSVMTTTISSLFNAGPAVVANATFEEGLSMKELGGPDMHARNGTIDNVAADEEAAFAQIRTVLSYLPNCGSSSLPPTIASTDPSSRTEEALRSIIPRRKNRAFSPRQLISHIVDKSSFFEIGSHWGTTIILGLARLNGKPIGIVANNPETNSGALDALGSQKLAKHLRFCDIFNIPILQFIDVPGYAIGTAAERSATMRHGVTLAMAYYTTTIPIFNVVVRRAYGVAGAIMLDCRDPRMRVCWPSGDWGSLPLEGGIEVGHRHELSQLRKEKGVEAAEQRYKELETDYRRLMNPVRTANAFGAEEIIDPAVTRPVVCQWAEHVYEELLPVRLQERIAGKLQPTFS